MPANSKQVPSGFSMMPQTLLCYNTTDLGVLRFRAKTLSVSRQTNHFLDTSAVHKKQQYQDRRLRASTSQRKICSPLTDDERHAKLI
jgi:hypothetical protein